METLQVEINDNIVKVGHMIITFETKKEALAFIQKITIEHLENYGLWGK